MFRPIIIGHHLISTPVGLMPNKYYINIYYNLFSVLIDSRVVRDNPTLSMINDSDEDVIYGSDTEEPLQPTKLIDTKNDDEESD